MDVPLRSAPLALAGLLLAGAGRAQEAVPGRAPIPIPGRPLVTCEEGARWCDVAGLRGIFVTTGHSLAPNEMVEERCYQERCWEWGFIPARSNGRREDLPLRPLPSPAVCGLATAACTFAFGQGPPRRTAPEPSSPYPSASSGD